MTHTIRNIVSALALVAASAASALPVDPAQQPVDIIQENTDYTLAYDDTNRSVIYYAPKFGRVALSGEKPLVGYTLLANGEAYLNVQYQFGVFGASKQRIIDAIKRAGYTPVAFPFRGAKMVPLMIDFDETTKKFCSEVPDPATGGTITVCSDMYKAIKYSQKGPTLGENLFVIAHLTPLGATAVDSLLMDGADFAIRIDAEYYKSGRMFEAKVRVDFSRLYENYQEVSSGGILWGRDRQSFFEREVLCAHKPPDRKHECGVFIEYTDLVTGKRVATPTLDPNNLEEQRMVLQAAERLYKQLNDELFTAVSQPVPWVGVPPRPLFGNRVRSQSYTSYKNIVREYVFTSPQSINVGTTEIPAVVHCIHRNSSGLIERNMNYPCNTYWAN